MDKDNQLNNSQNIPNSEASNQPNAPHVSSDNPFKNIQPIDIDEIEPYQPNAAGTSTNITNSTPSIGAPQKSNRLLIAIVAFALIAGGVVATLFATGIIGNLNEKRFEFGNYSVVIDDEIYDVEESPSDSPNTLLLYEKNNTYGLSLYQIEDTNEQAYEALKNKSDVSQFIKQNVNKNISVSDPFEKKNDNVKCIVYDAINLSNSEGYLTINFCELADGSLILANTFSDSNSKKDTSLDELIRILNTAKSN